MSETQPSTATETGNTNGNANDGRRLRDILVSVFILWNIFAVTVWVAPPSTQRKRLLTCVDRYLDVVGLKQNFVVFSPNVDSSNADLSALVTMANGTAKLWQYPRMRDMNLFQRLFKDGNLNYVFFMRLPENRIVFPDAARHIARLNYQDGERNNPPVEVTLRFDWEEIVPPGENRAPKSGHVSIFHYKVKPEDLQ